MKRLLKSEVFGSMNSAWMHCSWLTWSNNAAGTQKKKSKNANATTYNSNPNTHYGSIWIELIVAETEN